MNKMLGNKVAIAIFTLPALIFYTVFVFAGVIRTAIGSFYAWDGITGGAFAGLNNFKHLFSQDIFFLALKNGFIAAGILVFVQICLGLFWALILSEKEIRFKKAFRISFFLPVVISVSAVCILGIAVLSSEGGLLNNIFHSLGIKYSQSWLTTSSTAIFAISLVNAWQYMGFFLCVFYAGIKSIPAQYYEAAIIDGASKLKTYVFVIIPLLGDVIKFCLLFAMLGGLNQFAHNMILTGGGPGSSSYSMTLLMYIRGFGTNDYGYGSVIALVIVVQALLVSFIINKFMAREKISY